MKQQRLCSIFSVDYLTKGYSVTYRSISLCVLNPKILVIMDGCHDLYPANLLQVDHLAFKMLLEIPFSAYILFVFYFSFHIFFFFFETALFILKTSSG